MSDDTRPTDVLLVDDSAEDLRLMQAVLATDYQTRTASNTEDALRLIAESPPHFVICDIEMPGSTGLEFCQRVRETHTDHFIHVTLASVNTSPRRLNECLQVGADLFLPKPFAPDDLKACLLSGHRLHDLYTRLQDAAHTDPLTGLPTRHRFDEEAKREFERAQRHGLKLSCAVLDADFFKKVNDVHGHAAGDAVLREIARIIHEALRASDIPCRFGGEEFCVLLPETGSVGAKQWADRVRQSIESVCVKFNELELKVTASIGVAELADGCRGPADLFHQADEALLAAKQSGRNRVVTYRDVIASEEFNVADAQQEAFWSLPAGKIMSTIVATLSPEDTISDATTLLLRFRINAAPVVDLDGKLLGIVSEKDAMSRMTKPEDWNTPVSEAMNAHVISYEESTPIHSIHAFLCRAGIRRVVILRDEKPIGIIGRATILRAYRNWKETDSTAARSEELKAHLGEVVDAVVRQGMEIQNSLAKDDESSVAVIHGASRIQELAKDLLSAVKSGESTRAVVAD